MKAVINNGVTYKVTGEKGAFTICEDIKGKIKMFQTSTIEIVEAEFGKVKYANKPSVKKSTMQNEIDYKNSKTAKMTNDEWEAYRKNIQRNVKSDY
jgi:hypothetical protein